MAEKKLKELYSIQKQADQAVVFFRRPGENHIQYIEGEVQSDIVHWAKKKGFVIKPFDNQSTTPLIHIAISNQQEFLTSDFESEKFEARNRTEELNQDLEAKSGHLKLLRKAISHLQDGFLEKVVLARPIAIPKEPDFNPLQFFIRLCRWYPNTFCYYTHLPGYGSWIGASPELLLLYHNDKLETTALAGTIHKKSGQIWRGKETTEQGYVSDYIEDIFEDFNIDDYQKSRTAELPMGNIAHLQTTYIARKHMSTNALEEFVQELDPTPAVCGLPKQQAIDFILKNEIGPRKYYSGFLGEVDPNGITGLFVNLRCMEVKENELIIHAGGGITAESDPEEEWRETCVKANTLLSLL